MDEIRDAVSTRSPTAAAKEVLARHWDNNLPVNPGELARALGVAVVPAVRMGYSGFFDRTSCIIYYDRNESVVRQRFTVAHELGHFVLDHADAPRDKPDSFSASIGSSIESDANRFAAELLMPESAVRIVFASGRMDSVDEMASAFAVSKVAMTLRLKNLKLV